MTKDKNFNTIKNNIKVLICPLDWGLGHATRCIPVIREMQLHGCEILIGADGKPMDLLKNEFPNLTFLQLQGYNIRYAKNRIGLKWKMLIQIPKILYTIFKEHQWLKNVIKEHNIDIIISDNRFGLFNKKISSIYITHQLQIKTGNYFTDLFVRYLHYFFINKFNRCWVPDAPVNGLGGDLSHPEKKPANVQYLGPISRFTKGKKEMLYNKIFVLSGPEPQRSILENIIAKNTYKLPGKNLLIRGTNDIKEIEVSYNCTLKGLLSARELNDLIESSEMVISRAGYSTIMDLAKLQKKALLIPTPGQTEQEYLARHLMKNNMFYSMSQNNLTDLVTIFESMNNFPFLIKHFEWESYKTLINDFITAFKK